MNFKQVYWYIFGLILVTSIVFSSAASENLYRKKREEVEIGPNVVAAQATPESQNSTSANANDFNPCPKAKEVRASKEWLESVLNEHNKFRKLHDSQPLTLNNQLSEIAQWWADKMAGDNQFDHNGCLNAAKIGENLYFSASTVQDEKPVNETNGVLAWYDEINNYDYDTTLSHNNMEYLHFTQLVWRDTKEMGAAYSISSEPNSHGFYSKYLVVNYFPRGNYDDFKVNVVPPSGFSPSPSTFINVIIIIVALCVAVFISCYALVINIRYLVIKV